MKENYLPGVDERCSDLDWRSVLCCLVDFPVVVVDYQTVVDWQTEADSKTAVDSKKTVVGSQKAVVDSQCVSERTVDCHQTDMLPSGKGSFVAEYSFVGGLENVLCSANFVGNLAARTRPAVEPGIGGLLK